ncbi:MAG: M16 family metallopeptidase [Bacteroidales bacterium]
MLNRKIQPPVKLFSDRPFREPARFILTNGLPVYLQEGGTEEFVKIEVVVTAGSYHQDKPLVAFSAANLLRYGTKSKSRAEINEMLDFYSAFLHLEAQKDIVSAGMFVLNKHLEPALDLLAEMLHEPAFPEDDMHAFLKNHQQMHLLNQKKVSHLARTYFAELIYGEDHPYGYRLKTPDFERVERRDLEDFHSRHFHAGNSFVLVAGRVPDDMITKLEQRFGRDDQAGPAPSAAGRFPVISPGQRKVHLEVPSAVQSAIRVGKQLFNRTHPSYHKLKITNALLGGYYGSRLMQNIRQDKGYTYGIGSNIISLVHSGYFFIASQVGADVREAALEEVYRELKALRTVPADEKELEILKNYLSGSFLRSFDGPLAQKERFKELLVFGLDVSHYDDYLETLKTITAEDIMECATDYLHEDGMMEVVAGK